jgi:predicted PurR-regulated permease PerM
MRGGSGVKFVLIGFALAVLLYVAYMLRPAILLIFVSIIFSVIFLPCIEWIQRWRIRNWSPGRGTAILLFLAMVVAAIGVFLAFVVPSIAGDAQQLTRDLPHNLDALSEKVQRLPFGRTIAGRFNEESIRHWIEAGLQQAFSIFHGVLSGVMALLTLVLLSAYFMLDGQRAFRWAMSLVPRESRDRLSRTLSQGAERMQRWLYGQLTLMLILGSASAVVFGLLEIRYFYALAVFAGAANFVPILGPIATLVVASAVAALDSWSKVVGVLVFYAVYQQVENAYLTPKIMRKAVGLPGVAVIVALTLGGELGGLLGAIVAVPTAALIGTLVDEYVADQHSLEPVQSERAA